MIIGSHNSWSYLPPKYWWLYPFRFMSKCQSVDIKTQYEKYNVRCFDLRVCFNKKGNFSVAHGSMKFKITLEELLEHLNWLDNKGDVSVRILHEVRSKKKYTNRAVIDFVSFVAEIESRFTNIKFWCGKNLYNWENDYEFPYKPSCEEKYSSVCPPKIIDDWWPWVYARLHNKKIIKQGTDMDILLIDYVNFIK